MLRDLSHAFRVLRRSPGFALSAVCALALGIGANVAVFSVVYAVLLKPLPYPSPDRLVRLHEANPSTGVDRGDVSAGTFVDWRTRGRLLEDLAVYTLPADGQTLWSFGDRFEAVRISRVSPALFSILRAAPVLGRTFRPERDQPGASEGRNFVISFAFWQRAFGGAPDIIGRTVTVEGRFPAQIIGVMPRGFAFPESTDAWANQAFPGTMTPAERRAISYQAVARLSPSATIDAARQELDLISAQLGAEQPAIDAGWRARVEPFAGSDTGAARPALLALLAAVAGVLLIGCANVANLLLARAVARRHEMAVRLALGAGAARLVRLCLAESVVLSAAGLAAGLAVGLWLTRVLIRFAPPDIPRLNDVRMDVSVALYAAGAGLFCALLVGGVPALRAAGASRRGGLRIDARSASPRGDGARRLLVAGEVAIVVLLLTMAMLLVRTFAELRGVDLGFQPRQVLSVEARWPIGRLFPTTPGVRPWPGVQRAVDRLLEAVESVQGVEAAGLVTDVPLTGDPFSGTVWRSDAPGAAGLTPPADLRNRWSADLGIVTAGYFRAMNIGVVRGRNFSAEDRLSDEQLSDSSAPRSCVAIVNSAFASRYFPGEDPIGRTLVLYDDQEFGPSRTIVGVVADVRGRAVTEAARPAVFLPHGEHPDVFRPSIVVRSALPPDAVAGAIRARIHEVDPQILVQRIRPMDDVVAGALSRPRFNLLLLGSFALVALALAVVGIYGVVACVAVQRTREIGIRIALGARAQDILGLLMREGMTPVAAGALAGIAGSLLAARAMRGLLFGVTPLDPVSLTGAPALLAAVALVGCYVPARRALRVDPLVALREE